MAKLGAGGMAAWTRLMKSWSSIGLCGLPRAQPAWPCLPEMRHHLSHPTFSCDTNGFLFIGIFSELSLTLPFGFLTVDSNTACDLPHPHQLLSQTLGNIFLILPLLHHHTHLALVVTHISLHPLYAIIMFALASQLDS
jgi:hypothetical protein